MKPTHFVQKGLWITIWSLFFISPGLSAQVIRDGQLMSLKTEEGTLYFISPFMVEPLDGKTKCEIDLTWPYREETVAEVPARVMFSIWNRGVPFDDVKSFEVFQENCYATAADSLDQVRIKRQGKKWRTRYEGNLDPQVFIRILRKPEGQRFRITTTENEVFEFTIGKKETTELLRSGIVVKWETKYELLPCEN